MAVYRQNSSSCTVPVRRALFVEGLRAESIRRNRPIGIAGYIPDIPKELPFTRYYEDGDEGLSNDWRIREHWQPGSVWAGMKSTIPGVCIVISLYF